MITDATILIGDVRIENIVSIANRLTGVKIPSLASMNIANNSDIPKKIPLVKTITTSTGQKSPFTRSSLRSKCCSLKYSAKVDTGSPFDYDVSTGTGSWGLYADMKSKLTSTSGVSVTLANNFGKLGKAAQDYLTEKGFGSVSMGAGAVSFDPDTLKITLEGFKVADVNKFNYAPYADKYTTTQTVSLSKTIDLNNTFKAAVVILIVLSFIFLWEAYGIAALAEAVTTLGTAGIARLTNVL